MTRQARSGHFWGAMTCKNGSRKNHLYEANAETSNVFCFISTHRQPWPAKRKGVHPPIVWVQHLNPEWKEPEGITARGAGAEWRHPGTKIQITSQVVFPPTANLGVKRTHPRVQRRQIQWNDCLVFQHSFKESQIFYFPLTWGFKYISKWKSKCVQKINFSWKPQKYLFTLVWQIPLSPLTSKI